MDRNGWLVSHWALSRNPDELVYVPVWEPRRMNELAIYLVESMRGAPLPMSGEFVEAVMLPLCTAAAAESRRRWVERTHWYPDVPLVVDSLDLPGIESAFPVIFAINGPVRESDREELKRYVGPEWRNVLLFHTRSSKLLIQLLIREELLVATPVHERFRGTPDGRLADPD